MKSEVPQQCAVCFTETKTSTKCNQLIKCLKCDLSCHRYCYAPSSSSNSFTCDVCKSKQIDAQCQLCTNDGLLKQFEKGKFGHPLCLMFSPLFLIKSFEELTFFQIDEIPQPKKKTYKCCECFKATENVMSCGVDCQMKCHLYCSFKNHLDRKQDGWRPILYIFDSFEYHDEYYDFVTLKYLRKNKKVISRFLPNTKKPLYTHPMVILACANHSVTQIECSCRQYNEFKTEWIFCDGCSRWMHQDCVGLSEKIKADLKKSRSAEYVCLQCTKWHNVVQSEKMEMLNRFPKMQLYDMVYIQKYFEENYSLMNQKQKRFIFQLSLVPGVQYAQKMYKNQLIKEKIHEKLFNWNGIKLKLSKIKQEPGELYKYLFSLHKKIQAVNFLVNSNLILKSKDKFQSILLIVTEEQQFGKQAKQIIKVINLFENYETIALGTPSKILKEIAAYYTKIIFNEDLKKHRNQSGEDRKRQKLAKRYVLEQVKRFNKQINLLKGTKNQRQLLEIIKEFKNIFQDEEMQILLREANEQLNGIPICMYMKGFTLFDSELEILEYIKGTTQFLCCYIAANRLKQMIPTNPKVYSKLLQNTKILKNYIRKIPYEGVKFMINKVINQAQIQGKITCEISYLDERPKFIEIENLLKKNLKDINLKQVQKIYNIYKEWENDYEQKNQRTKKLLELENLKYACETIKKSELNEETYNFIQKLCLQAQSKSYKVSQCVLKQYFILYKSLKQFTNFLESCYFSSFQSSKDQSLLQIFCQIKITSNQKFPSQRVRALSQFYWNIYEVNLSLFNQRIYQELTEKFEKFLLRISQNFQIFQNEKQYKCVVTLTQKFKITHPKIEYLVKLDQETYNKYLNKDINFDNPRSLQDLENNLKAAHDIYLKEKLIFRAKKLRVLYYWIVYYWDIVKGLDSRLLFPPSISEQFQQNENKIQFVYLRSICDFFQFTKFPDCSFLSNLKMVYEAGLPYFNQIQKIYSKENWEYDQQTFLEVYLDENYNKVNLKEFKQMKLNIQKEPFSLSVDLLEIGMMEEKFVYIRKQCKSYLKKLKMMKQYTKQVYDKVDQYLYAFYRLPFYFHHYNLLKAIHYTKPIYSNDQCSLDLTKQFSKLEEEFSDPSKSKSGSQRSKSNNENLQEIVIMMENNPKLFNLTYLEEIIERIYHSKEFITEKKKILIDKIKQKTIPMRRFLDSCSIISKYQKNEAFKESQIRIIDELIQKYHKQAICCQYFELIELDFKLFIFLVEVEERKWSSKIQEDVIYMKNLNQKITSVHKSFQTIAIKDLHRKVEKMLSFVEKPLDLM